MVHNFLRLSIFDNSFFLFVGISFGYLLFSLESVVRDKSKVVKDLIIRTAIHLGILGVVLSKLLI